MASVCHLPQQLGILDRNLAENLAVETLVLGAIVILFVMIFGLRRKLPILPNGSWGAYAHPDSTGCKPEEKASLASVRGDMAELVSQHCAAAARRKANSMERTKLSDILKQYADNGKLEEMSQLFEEIEKRFRPFLNLMDYHCVIVSLARGGDPQSAHRWLQRCRSVGLNAKQGTFNSVIHAYAKKGTVTKAMEVLDEMRLAGEDFNTCTYNAIMYAWARVGDSNQAQKWMNTMLKTSVQPNVYSFGTVMLACSADDLQEELDFWFEQSQQRGFEISEYTYDSIVRTFARKHDAANALKWVAIMIENHAKPSIYCCMEVLTSIFKQGDVQLASTLIDRMRSAGVQPDSAFYSRCIQLAVQSDHGGQAKRWADECALGNGRLSWAAKQAMLGANLTIPKVGKGKTEASSPQDDTADGDVEPSSDLAVVVGPMDSNEAEAQQMTSKQTVWAARRAAIGKRYSGTIKDFVPGQFGYITCAAIRDLFQRDVFLGRHENPEMLTKGQRVSFTLRVDDHVDRPRAADVSAVRPADLN